MIIINFIVFIININILSLNNILTNKGLVSGLGEMTLLIKQ